MSIYFGSNHGCNSCVTTVTLLNFLDDLGVEDEGENINGPSLIRIPDWISPSDRADPSAVYYLYFGNHTGDYIRMAWAENIIGPWNLYQTGSNVSRGNRGVLDNGGRDIAFARLDRMP